MQNNLSWKLPSEATTSSGDNGKTSTIPLNTTTNWTIIDTGTSVGTINTGSMYFNCAIPTGAVNPSGSRAVYDLAASIVPDFTLTSLEVVCRVKAATNVDVNSRIECFLSGAAGAAPTVIISVWGNGSIETGWNSSSGFTSFGWSAAGTFPFAGNSWLRVMLSGGVANFFWGTGVTRPTQWQMIQSRPLPTALAGENPITTVVVGGLHLAVPASDVNIQMSDITITTV